MNGLKQLCFALVSRLSVFVTTLCVIVCLSFLLIRLAPGSPFASDKAVAPAVREALDTRYGLDQPTHVQLGRYLQKLFSGDLGPSLRYPQRDVSELFNVAVGPTATLAGLSLLWALVWGFFWAFSSAWSVLERRSHADAKITSSIAMVMGTPSFVLGPIFSLFLAGYFHILPVAGWGTFSQAVLPTLTLGTILSAQIARLLRGGFLAAIKQPFMEQAKAKGLKSSTLLLRHALKPGLVPLLSHLAPMVSGLLVGSVAIERIFMIPGLGVLFVDAAFNRDYFVLMSIVLFESCVLLILNNLVDASFALVDPRVRIHE